MRFMKLTIPAALSMFLLSLSTPSFGQPISPGVPDTVLPAGVGVNIHFTSGHIKDLDMIAAAGFKFVRMDLTWANTETAKGVYDWSAYDDLVSNLNQRGLRAILILDYNNSLYTTGGTRSGPQDSSNIAAYAKWAAAAVKHFQGNHIIWEIWNEPNNGSFWKPTPNAGQYATMALAACKAIRQANSTATIIGPAADRFPSDLLDSVMTSGVIDYLNAVSVHPYRGALYPETAASYTPSSTPNDRGYHWLDSLIALYEPAGKHIPIICSEWGYSNSSLSLQTQADYLARIQLFNLYNGIPLSIWYDWTGGNSGFNIINAATMQPLPAYTAANVLTRELTRFHVAGRYDTGNDSDFVLILSNPGDSVKVAAWTVGRPDQVTLPLSSLSMQATARTIWWVDGNADTGSVNVHSGNFTIRLTGSPTYYSTFPQVSPVLLPHVPPLISPADSATEIIREPELIWSGSFSYFGTEYRLQVATAPSNPNGSFQAQDIVLDTTLADTFFHLTRPLDSNTTYYWHVYSSNIGGTSGYGAAQSFKTGSVIALPSRPVNVEPAYQATGVPRKPTLAWISSLYADEYELEVASDYHTYTSGDSVGMFLPQNVVYDTTVTDTFFHVTVPLDSSTTYYWQVRGINAAGKSIFSSTGLFKTGTGLTAIERENPAPNSFALLQNFPNPFNPTTTIQFDLKETSVVTLDIYNVLGERVEYCNYGMMESGRYSREINLSRFASGVYFYRLVAEALNGDEFVSTKKLILMK